jgi:HD superfamily phosphohydrolase
VKDFYDPIYGRIIVPSEYATIVDAAVFRRLQYLRQLGLCYLSFPGGNHTRFEHSLGAFHLASLIGAALEKSTVGSVHERKRLTHMLQLSALCHDIGHGPFSHMSENVLLGLGASVTHEEMGAAILNYYLRDAFRPFNDLGISSELIGSLLTHSPHSDPMATCAMDLVSSDLDVDRLDYLQRDAHYAGYRPGITSAAAELEDVWSLTLCNHTFYLELTEFGVRYAEGVLFLRRNNYQRIVFDSRHMSATGMFEKALYYSYNTTGSFGQMLQSAVTTQMDWSNLDQVKSVLPTLEKVYQMVDYEALKRIEESHGDARYLISRIRRGNLYHSLRRWGWDKLHYLLKHRLMSHKKVGQAFKFRRGIEKFLSRAARINVKHITVHIPDVRLPKPLLLGVQGGGTITDNSEVGHFLHNDFLRQYVIEVFIDPQVDEKARSVVLNMSAELFEQGHVDVDEITGI